MYGTCCSILTGAQAPMAPALTRSLFKTNKIGTFDFWKILTLDLQVDFAGEIIALSNNAGVPASIGCSGVLNDKGEQVLVGCHGVFLAFVAFLRGEKDIKAISGGIFCALM